MNLPQCYLADLPAGAELSSSLIHEAWLALERNRVKHLARATTRSMISVLAEAADHWLRRDSSFMKLALDLGVQQLGFSRETLEHGLRQMLGSITVAGLEGWVEQDLGHPHRLDEFCADGPERVSQRRSKAVGPHALAQITSGNIPSSGVISVVAGFLVRSAQFIRCARGTSLIPRLFAHTIRAIDPDLGACLEIAEWPRRRDDLLEALIRPADCVTVTGSDETVAAVRGRVPVHKRFIGHGHRLSFAYIGAQTAGNGAMHRLIEGVAEDVCAWNQLGCLSPHVIYLQEGGALRPEEFARQLAGALARIESIRPRGRISERESATIRSRRAFYEVRAAHSPETRLWQSPDSTAWTVVLEADSQFQTSCLNRFVYVKHVANIGEALRGADPVRHQVSTVALAAIGSQSHELLHQLADWGVRRICPIGSMQSPSLLWRHNGRPALEELVLWTDLEEHERSLAIPLRPHQTS